MPFFLILQTFPCFSNATARKLSIFASSNCANKQELMTYLFDKGKASYEQQVYDDAVRYFARGSAEQLCSSCRMWLGQCCEYGLGTTRDLAIAKDLYRISFSQLGMRNRESEQGVWLQKRITFLSTIPDSDECSRLLEGIGNVRVKKHINAPHTPTIRFNKNEVVVTIDKRTPFTDGFLYAKKALSSWTCDGTNRFYDGYRLKTDYIDLIVQRSEDNEWHSYIDKKVCTLHFPHNTNLEYICAQETILRKVQDLFFERAKAIIPKRLKEITDLLGLPEKTCKIVKKLRGAYATNYTLRNIIEVKAGCIQLPIDSLDSLLIHEITHDFVLGHGSDFYRKMKELGGKHLCDLDKNLFEEGRWLYIRF